MLRPTLRPVGQVEREVGVLKRRHGWVKGDIAKVWSVSPLQRATYFSEFASLLLPDADSAAGACLDWNELVALLTLPHTRPKSVLGIASLRTGFTLQHWAELNRSIEPKLQEFSAGGRVYDLGDVMPEDPWTGPNPYSK